MVQKLLVLLVLACTGQTTVEAAETAPIWIDVRTVQEYESGHLPGALNISFEHLGARISEITTDRRTAIRLYCQSGRRSGLAKQTLEKLGYVNVVNAGGLNLVLRNAQAEPTAGPDCAINNC